MNKPDNKKAIKVYVPRTLSTKPKRPAISTEGVIAKPAPKKGYIYLHMFPNGRAYIGKTVQDNPANRWSTQKSHAMLGYLKGESPKLMNAIRLYGWDKCTHEILVICPPEMVDHYETTFIRLYDSIANGYNLETGGDGGKKACDETRLLQSRSHAGSPNPNSRRHGVGEDLPARVRVVLSRSKEPRGYSLVKHPLCHTEAFYVGIREAGSIAVARSVIKLITKHLDAKIISLVRFPTIQLYVRIIGTNRVIRTSLVHNKYDGPAWVTCRYLLRRAYAQMRAIVNRETYDGYLKMTYFTPFDKYANRVINSKVKVVKRSTCVKL